MEKRKFKTTKVLSGVRTEYRAWKEWSEDDTLVAKLLGTSQNRKAKTKVDWIVEVIEPFFSDKKEEKRLKPGTRLTLNTAGQFDKGMKQLQMGEKFQVIYKGSVVMEGGEYAGDPAHTMEVTGVIEENNDEAEEKESHDDESSEDDDL